MSSHFWARLTASFMILLAIVMVALTWRATIAGYGPLPFWDQWERVTPLQHLSRLFEAHNEHRIVLPTFFFVLDGLLFGGRNVFSLFVIQLIQAFHAILLIWLLRKGGVQGPHLTIGGALIVALLFSGAQIENFYWGFQVQFVAVFFLATLCLCVSVFAPSRIRYDILAAVLALGAAFSLSAGLLAAPAAALAAFLSGRGWRRVGVLAAAALFSAFIYFSGYEPNPGHSDPGSSLAHPVEVFYYALVYIGAPFGDAIAKGPLAEAWPTLADPVIASKYVGALGIGAFGFLAPVTVFKLKSRSGLVLAGICGVIVFAAVLTGLGRWQLGAQQAMASRYATPVLIFWSGLYSLVAVSALPFEFRFRKAVLLGWGAAGIAAVIVLAGNWRSWTDLAEAQGARLHQAESAVLVGVNDAQILTTIYPASERVLAQAYVLASARLSIFDREEFGWLGRSLSDLDVEWFEACVGSIDLKAAINGDQAQIRAEGWAWNWEARAAVGRVLLADEAGTIVGVGYGGRARPDVMDALDGVTALETGWLAHARSMNGVITVYAAPKGRGLRLCRIGER